MKNDALVQDHLVRCAARLKAIDVLMKEKSWADVVRESQEVVELSLKALLRRASIEVPRIHDVGSIVVENAGRLPPTIRGGAERLAGISRRLRRDRELAFYGSEDLTPSEFYRQEDAKEARDSARWVVETVTRGCGG